MECRVTDQSDGWVDPGYQWNSSELPSTLRDEPFVFPRQLQSNRWQLAPTATNGSTKGSESGTECHSRLVGWMAAGVSVRAIPRLRQLRQLRDQRPTRLLKVAAPNWACSNPIRVAGAWCSRQRSSAASCSCDPLSQITVCGSRFPLDPRKGDAGKSSLERYLTPNRSSIQ